MSALFLLLRVSTVATFDNAVSVMNISGVPNQYHRPKKYKIVQFSSTYSVDTWIDTRIDTTPLSTYSVDSRVDTWIDSRVDTWIALNKHKLKHKLKHKQNINKSSSR